MLRNLTPHRLCVIDSNGAAVLDLAASKPAARIAQDVVAETTLDGVLIRTIRYGIPTDLPDPVAGTVLVVARVVAQQISRDDLVFPDEEVRDEAGRVVGCRALARFVP